MTASARTVPPPTKGELDLPPLFRLLTLREAGDAFTHAQAVADEMGAGTIVWTRRFDLVEFAVVLEPDEPLERARRAFYAGMTALTDALAAHAPPERTLAVDWPDSVLFEGGLIGGGRLAAPEGTGEQEAPRWLVFGAMLRSHAMTEIEPGLHTMGASLTDEGFEDADAGRIIESFSRHLMVAVDEWQGDGFDRLARRYLESVPVEQGERRAIDGNGDLLIWRPGAAQPERQALRAALAAQKWFDPEAREPFL